MLISDGRQLLYFETFSQVIIPLEYKIQILILNEWRAN